MVEAAVGTGVECRDPGLQRGGERRARCTSGWWRPLTSVVDGLEIVFVDDGSTGSAPGEDRGACGTGRPGAGPAVRPQLRPSGRAYRRCGCGPGPGGRDHRCRPPGPSGGDSGDGGEVAGRRRGGLRPARGTRGRDLVQEDDGGRRSTACCSAITNVEIPVDTGDFRLMGPRAVAAFRALPERNRFIRGLVSWIGFPPDGRALPPPGAARRRDQVPAAQDVPVRPRRHHLFFLLAAQARHRPRLRSLALRLPLHPDRHRAQVLGHQLAGLHLA